MSDESLLQLIEDGDKLIYQFKGAFDAATVQKVREQIEGQVEAAAKQHLIDLSNVSFVDSSGIGAIVHLFKRLKVNNKGLVIIGATGQPADLLKMLRIDKVIKVAASVDDL